METVVAIVGAGPDGSNIGLSKLTLNPKRDPR